MEVGLDDAVNVYFSCMDAFSCCFGFVLYLNVFNAWRLTLSGVPDAEHGFNRLGADEIILAAQNLSWLVVVSTTVYNTLHSTKV